VFDTALPRGPGVSAEYPTSPSELSRDFFGSFVLAFRPL